MIESLAQFLIEYGVSMSAAAFQARCPGFCWSNSKASITVSIRGVLLRRWRCLMPDFDPPSARPRRTRLDVQRHVAGEANDKWWEKGRQ